LSASFLFKKYRMIKLNQDDVRQAIITQRLDSIFVTFWGDNFITLTHIMGLSKQMAVTL
jgi:hypothetical protein